jgi:hypothetical protein
MYPIASYTVGAGGTASITFSSIPQTFTHLQIRVFTLNSASTGNITLQFNNDSGGNYSRHEIKGDGSAAGSYGVTNDSFVHVGYYISASASNPYISIIDVLDYTNTNKYKTTRCINGIDQNGSGGIAMLTSGNWRNTNAITSFALGETFLAGSRVDLYGITTSNATGA